MQNEVRLFQRKIEVLNKFLIELAAREEEIITFGLKRASDWKSYKKALPVIDEFEIDFLEIEELAKHIDYDVYKQIKSIKEESKIIEQLTTISIQLNLLTQRKRLSASTEMFNTVLFQLPFITGIFRHRRLFAKEEISIQNTLVSLKRLTSLSKRLEKIFLKGLSLDNEIFKPSKVDSNALLELLNFSISSLQKSNSLPASEKILIIENIISVKVEIAKEKPNWNKAIGALVIVATLLGGIDGIAATPQAYENITKAIQHILGVSIEKHVPNILPSPSPDKAPRKEKTSVKIIQT